MKNIVIKIIISIVIIVAVLFAIRFFSEDNTSMSDGVIHLYIIDSDDHIVFDDELEFFEGDTFYDILDRNFNLTCANGSYQPDETCSYQFQSFGYQGMVVLGIKNDDFEVITDWTNSFLLIEKHDGDQYRLTTLGVSHIDFNNQDRFKIIVKNAWE